MSIYMWNYQTYVSGQIELTPTQSTFPFKIVIGYFVTLKCSKLDKN